MASLIVLIVATCFLAYSNGTNDNFKGVAGCLFGIGVTTGQANLRVISQILGSWLLTLPLAATLAAVLYRLF